MGFVSKTSLGTLVGHNAITSCTLALPPKKDAPGGPFNCIGLISGMIFAHSFLSSEKTADSHDTLLSSLMLPRSVATFR